MYARIRGAVEDVVSKLNEGAKVSGAMNKIWEVGSLGKENYV